MPENVELPSECKTFKNDLLPLSDPISVLSEEYNITHDPEDFVPSAELIDYLQSNGFEGSATHFGRIFTRIGLDADDVKINRKTVRIRRGIKKLESKQNSSW